MLTGSRYTPHRQIGLLAKYSIGSRALLARLPPIHSRCPDIPHHLLVAVWGRGYCRAGRGQRAEGQAWPLQKEDRSLMTPQVQVALILGTAIIIAVGIWVYFSPYHSCIRAGHTPYACVGGRG